MDYSNMNMSEFFKLERFKQNRNPVRGKALTLRMKQCDFCKQKIVFKGRYTRILQSDSSLVLSKPVDQHFGKVGYKLCSVRPSLLISYCWCQPVSRSSKLSYNRFSIDLFAIRDAILEPYTLERLF